MERQGEGGEGVEEGIEGCMGQTTEKRRMAGIVGAQEINVYKSLQPC